MRSRNGSSPFSLSICTITFFLLYSSAIYADEYLISYRYTVKNATLYNETLDISKAMKKCKGEATSALYLDPEKSNNLKDILLHNKEQFTTFLGKIGFYITNQELTYNDNHTSNTIITLKTTCFKVDFNEKFVKISPLK